VDSKSGNGLRSSAQFDHLGLACGKLRMGCGAKLRSVRTVNFNMTLLNRLIRRVPDRTGEHLAMGIVPDAFGPQPVTSEIPSEDKGASR